MKIRWDLIAMLIAAAIFTCLCVHASLVDQPAVDVAPIQEEYGNPGYEFCDMGCTWVDAQNLIGWNSHIKTYRRTRATCADKTRFLMTSEDGKQHCIRLAI